MSIYALRAFDRRQIFRFFVDGRLLTRYRGWQGYDENESGSVHAMLAAYGLMFDNFDLSQGLRAGYLRQLHKACTVNVGMRNVKSSPGDLRYLESAYTFHAGVTTLDSLHELFELRRGDRSPLFFTRGYDKTAEELDVHQVYKAIQDLGELKFRPWYPRLTKRQKESLDQNGTRIFDCSFEEFYQTKHDIQMQYALRLDEIIMEFNTTMATAVEEDDKLLAISKIIRKLELLHAFPDGNGRTYVSALMNHLLLYYGFDPAILFNPNWDAELSYREWAEEMRRGMDNTRTLLRNPHLRLHNFSIDDADPDSITTFLGMTAEFAVRLDRLCERMQTPLSRPQAADRSLSVQRFLHLLRRCHPLLVREEEDGVLVSDLFDPETGTLSATLDGSDPALTQDDLAALHVLRHIHGDLILGGPHLCRLDGLDNLRSISGALILKEGGVEALNGFARLEIAGEITLSAMSRLTSINGFNSLLSVRDGIRIAANPRLTDINGFNALASVGASLTIFDNACLSFINGFNALRQITRGSLEIIRNPALFRVNGLQFLESISQSLTISEALSLTDFGFLAALKQARHVTITETGLSDGISLRRLFRTTPNFPGAIKITSNPKLTHVQFLAGLQSTGSSFYLHLNRLVSLDGLDSLENVGGSFTLSANELTDLSPLARLKQVDGILSLSRNHLHSLKGLDSLESVRTANWGGTLLSIKLNDNRDPDGRISLTDISALANVKERSGHLILIADETHGYAHQPARDSAYFSNKLDVIRQG